MLNYGKLFQDVSRVSWLLLLASRLLPACRRQDTYYLILFFPSHLHILKQISYGPTLDKASFEDGLGDITRFF